MNSSEIIWRCPSNIALVKYWGKKDIQIPCNPSLSLTLSNSYTEVKLVLGPKRKKEIEAEYFFHGEPNDTFKQRIIKYLSANHDYFSVLEDHSISIHSENSFPHSAGIASSASSFGAIALALLSASTHKTDFFKEASFLARLGSGSACRSMYAPYALWGKLNSIEHSSDEFAIPVKNIHSDFENLQDTILIVDDSVKKVSSSLGHSLMNGHVYAQARFKQASAHCDQLLNVLQSGDKQRFISIIEKEALALHAMMMTSEDYFILMKPGTLQLIDKIIDFRKESGTFICFTLDAGPNIHLLYRKQDAELVTDFIHKELSNSVINVIYDHAGGGPQKVTA